jgi:hypothetical protein
MKFLMLKNNIRKAAATNHHIQYTEKFLIPIHW